jgi:hypothetical protein
VDDLVIDSFDARRLEYTAVIKNSSGNLLCKGTPAKGPIVLQSYLSSVPDLFADSSYLEPAGGIVVVFDGDEIPPGGSRSIQFYAGSAPYYTGEPTFDPERMKYLIIQIYSAKVRGGESPTGPLSHEENSGCRQVVVERAIVLPYE